MDYNTWLQKQFKPYKWHIQTPNSSYAGRIVVTAAFHYIFECLHWELIVFLLKNQQYSFLSPVSLEMIVSWE